MTLAVLAFIAVSLTCTMFITRESMLGVACVLFWSIFGGYAYTQSTIPWGDWQYYLAIGSLLGMNVLCGFGAFGLREKRDTLGEEQIEKGDGTYIDETKSKPAPMSRTDGIRARAEARRQKSKKNADFRRSI